MCNYWGELLPDVKLVLAYGGTQEEFDGIDWQDKVFIDDQTLRTKNHQRECQSYTAVYRGVLGLLSGRGFDRILLTEFDHVPLRSDYFNLLELARDEARADVMMYGLYQVNDIGHAHSLYHATKVLFFEQIERISLRSEKDVVFSSYGFGQYWQWEAFEEMAKVNDEVGCYLEIWAPTIAHHLGFRVKRIKDVEKCNNYYGDFTDRVEELKNRGGWCAHPVKKYWD